MQSADPLGYSTLQRHYAEICNAPLDPAAIGDCLFALAIIPSSVRESALLYERRDAAADTGFGGGGGHGWWVWLGVGSASGPI